MDEHRDQNSPERVPAVQDTEQNDLQAASKSTADYTQFVPPVGKQPKRRSGKLWIILLIIVLAVLGFAGWRLLKPQHKTPAVHMGKTAQQTKTTAIATTTKAYNSSAFGLSFNYPSNWTVTEADNTNQIVARSTVLSLTDATGQKVNGRILFTVDQKGQNLTMFDQGNAVAVLDSQKISYAKPSPTQRAQTYLSFLQYAATTAQGALDGVYVTGDYGYQTGQAIPKVDIAKVDPLIRVTFVKCSDAACSNTTPLSVASSSWSDVSLTQPIEALFKSLVVQ